MKREIEIAGRKIGDGHPVFIVAEMSGNHCGRLDVALEIVDAAAQAGADAIKLQTFKPERLAAPGEMAGDDTIWRGKTLRELYEQTYLPWDWHAEIFQYANSRGLICFSSPFDEEAVAFLETLDCPAYKIASAEIVDHDLIRATAATGKPLIVSTGASTDEDIGGAFLAAYRTNPMFRIAFLKCTAAYPAKEADMNLLGIRTLSKACDVVGLSDHSLGSNAAAAAVCLGASIIEKHITLDRNMGGPDAAFSIEPWEFRDVVQRIRATEAMLGIGKLECHASEAAALKCRGRRQRAMKTDN